MAEPIDLETQRLGITTPKLFALMGAVACALFCSGMAYSQLATEDYVDTRAKTVDGQLMELAKAQTASSEQITALGARDDTHEKDIGTIVKLVKIQFVEQVDEREARGPRARRRPRSAKSRRVAELLQLDPDDPMAGLELLEAVP